MRFVRGTILLITLAFAPSAAHAAFPQPTGYVNDFANVIQPGTRSQLENALSSLESNTGIEVAVATVQTLDDRPIEDYAVDLYKTWGIGKKDKDEGVLILVAPNDRQVRIEVGYGLEGAINDAKAGDIIRTLMIPYFKEGDFTKGIVAGTQAVAGIALKGKGIDTSKANSEANSDGAQNLSTKEKSSLTYNILKILFILLMIYLFIRHPWLFLLVLSNVGRGGGRGFGGGFGGFGGGLSGGGGASGRW